MKTNLHTPVQQGYIDFLSGIIALNNKFESDIFFIEKALSAKTRISNKAAHLRSLVAHEVTHLLDLYTTTWGLNYLYRKNIMYKSRKTEKFNKHLEVFMLNTSELESHAKLSSQPTIEKLTEASHITHSLIYNNKYGAMIMVNYMKGKNIALKVPLSMLSLLEANAISSEYISRINDAKTNKDPSTDIRNIESDFYEILDNPKLSEYSLLLFVLHTHFGSLLELDELLKFASTLIRKCLDSSFMFCSEFGTIIKDTFENKKIGYDISMDLCRGMSRQVIFFKTILLMYSWMQNIETKKKIIHLSKIKSDPNSAIEHFFLEIGLRDDFKISNLEYKNSLDSLSEIEEIPDYLYAVDLKKNRDLLKQKNVGSILNLIHSPAILLEDETEANPALIITHNHLDFVKNNQELYSEIDAIYENNKHKKFHPPLGAGLEFFSKK